MSIVIKTRSAYSGGPKFVECVIDSVSHDLGLLYPVELADLASTLRDAADDLHALEAAETAAYAEGRKDEREESASLQAELLEALKTLVSADAAGALDNAMFARAAALILKAEGKQA